MLLDYTQVKNKDYLKELKESKTFIANKPFTTLELFELFSMVGFHWEDLNDKTIVYLGKRENLYQFMKKRILKELNSKEYSKHFELYNNPIGNFLYHVRHRILELVILIFLTISFYQFNNLIWILTLIGVVIYVVGLAYVFLTETLAYFGMGYVINRKFTHVDIVREGSLIAPFDMLRNISGSSWKFKDKEETFLLNKDMLDFEDYGYGIKEEYRESFFNHISKGKSQMITPTFVVENEEITKSQLFYIFRKVYTTDLRNIKLVYQSNSYNLLKFLCEYAVEKINQDKYLIGKILEHNSIGSSLNNYNYAFKIILKEVINAFKTILGVTALFVIFAKLFNNIHLVVPAFQFVGGIFILFLVWVLIHSYFYISNSFDKDIHSGLIFIKSKYQFEFDMTDETLNREYYQIQMYFPFFIDLILDEVLKRDEEW